MKTIVHGVCVLGILLASSSAFAQGTGEISGTIKNPKGGIAPGVVVQATDTSTGASFKATSSAQGTYTITDLPPGSYDIVATLSGVPPFTVKGVAVSPDTTTQLDIEMKEGSQLRRLRNDDPLEHLGSWVYDLARATSTF